MGDIIFFATIPDGLVPIEDAAGREFPFCAETVRH